MFNPFLKVFESEGFFRFSLIYWNKVCRKLGFVNLFNFPFLILKLERNVKVNYSQ
jgi:hypothetical protein